MAQDPRIVAELGRPETAQEAADRRAAASRERRANQTAINLLIALGATLLVVVVLVAVVVRPDADSVREGVDWRAEAAAAQTGAEGVLLSPDLPEGWTANRADLQKRQDTLTWTIGLLPPDGGWLAIEQGFDATAEWVRTAAAVTDDDELFAAPTQTIGGRSWWVLDRRDDRAAPGNHPYTIATVAGAATVVVHGTASDEDVASVAAALASQLDELEGAAG